MSPGTPIAHVIMNRDSGADNKAALTTEIETGVYGSRLASGIRPGRTS